MNGRRCSGSSRVLPRGPPEKDISAYGHKYGHAEYKRAHTGSGDGVHRPAHGRVSTELGKHGGLQGQYAHQRTGQAQHFCGRHARGHACGALSLRWLLRCRSSKTYMRLRHRSACRDNDMRGSADHLCGYGRHGQIQGKHQHTAAPVDTQPAHLPDRSGRRPGGRSVPHAREVLQNAWCSERCNTLPPHRTRVSGTGCPRTACRRRSKD